MPHKCPNPAYGSDTIVWLSKKQAWFCQDCDHRWSAAPETTQPASVPLSQAEDARVMAFCRDLAGRDTWGGCPGRPAVAHEYLSLQEVLAG